MNPGREQLLVHGSLVAIASVLLVWDTMFGIYYPMRMVFHALFIVTGAGLVTWFTIRPGRGAKWAINAYWGSVPVIWTLLPLSPIIFILAILGLMHSVPWILLSFIPAPNNELKREWGFEDEMPARAWILTYGSLVFALPVAIAWVIMVVSQWQAGIVEIELWWMTAPLLFLAAIGAGMTLSGRRIAAVAGSDPPAIETTWFNLGTFIGIAALSAFLTIAQFVSAPALPFRRPL